MFKLLLKILELILAGIRPHPAEETQKQKAPPAPAPGKSDDASTKPAQVRNAEAWMAWARHEAMDGIPEEPNHDNRGPVIDRYIALAKCGTPGDPYCAIMVNAAHEQCGLAGTRSALARSFEHHPNFVKLPGPAYGAVTVFWRGSPGGGQGHAAFYDSETDTHVYTLGANQHDDFNVSPFPKQSDRFGLVGYFWHRSVPLPKTGAIRHGGQAAAGAAGKVT